MHHLCSSTVCFQVASATVACTRAMKEAEKGRVQQHGLTVLRGQSKQFPIPKERRGTEKDHEGLLSVKLALWVLRGV